MHVFMYEDICILTTMIIIAQFKCAVYAIIMASMPFVLSSRLDLTVSMHLYVWPVLLSVCAQRRRRCGFWSRWLTLCPITWPSSLFCWTSPARTTAQTSSSWDTSERSSRYPDLTYCTWHDMTWHNTLSMYLLNWVHVCMYSSTMHEWQVHLP